MQKELSALDLDSAEYALLHIKQRYYIGGNKAGRMLANKLRAKTMQQGVSALRGLNGALLHSDADIAAEFGRFYADIYSSLPVAEQDIACYLVGIPLPSLSPDEIEQLEADIRLEEVISAISRLQLGKAPGSVGFTPAFYKQYCKVLAQILVPLSNSFASRGTYPGTMLEVVISVILKPGKDPLHLFLILTDLAPECRCQDIL